MKESNKEAKADLFAFDTLPKEVRDLLNYANTRISSEVIKSIIEQEEDYDISRLILVKRKIQQDENFAKGMAKLQLERMRREQVTKNRHRGSSEIYFDSI